MITSFADLLHEFMKKEAEILDRENISHAPTIGAMYEGLTRSMVKKTIPEVLNLRVTDGFIVNDRGELSRQIDCMLVTGEGEQIPHTESHRYSSVDVVAVIEVKKNLYSNELESAYANLLSVSDIQDYSGQDFFLVRGAYRDIVGEIAPAFSEIGGLPTWQAQILHVLLMEEVFPLRIVLGYHGFTNELKFRDSYTEFLAANIDAPGFGPQSMPNLIICGSFSILKLNGMPYGSPIVSSVPYPIEGLTGLSDGPWWPLMSSYSANPLILLLELIWTRLAFHHNVKIMDYSDDLGLELLKPLLLARAIRRDSKIGWEYYYWPFTVDELNSFPPVTSWQPAFVNEAQAAILLLLFEHGSLGFEDDLLIEVKKEEIEDLRMKRLVTIDENRLVLLTNECRVIALPTGKIVAADDFDGRLTKWINKNYINNGTVGS